MGSIGKNLIIVANGFNSSSGPSVTLFHLLRGISKYFTKIYVISTIQDNISFSWFESFLPQNIVVLYIPRSRIPQTVYYGLGKNLTIQLGKVLGKVLQKLSEKHRSEELHLYIASDIFNLLALSTSYENEFLVGYNVLFTIAPPPIIMRSGGGLIIEGIKNFALSLVYEYIDAIATCYIGRILAHTNYQRHLYITYRNIDKERIIVFPHLIDRDFILQLVQPAILRKPSSKECKLVFVGRLISEKGLHILLEAFSKVVKRGYPAKLKIIGKGPLWTLVVKYKKRLGGRLVWYGDASFPESTVIKIIADSDILVLPSLNELFGFVILEALSLNKRVIASRVGGIPEILSLKCGSLVAPGDVDSLADAIIHECENLRTDEQSHYCGTFIRRFDTKYRAEEFVEIVERYGALDK